MRRYVTAGKDLAHRDVSRSRGGGGHLSRATIEEMITNGLDAMRGWIAAMRAEGHAIPAPTRSAAA